MSLMLYAHPFSSYCQNVLVALWENNTPFSYRHLEEPGVGAELTELWPIGKFPVLIDADVLGILIDRQATAGVDPIGLLGSTGSYVRRRKTSANAERGVSPSP